MVCRLLPRFFIAASVVVGFCFSVCRSETLQSQESYAAAIANSSSSPSFVLITIIDDATGASRTGCTEANFLVGALNIEHHFEAGEYRGEEFALAARNHSFHLRSPKALANVSFNELEIKYSEACQIIRSGHSAYMMDRTGQIREGRPH